MQSSLASALVQDVTQISGQTSPISNFLGVTALVLMFSLGLHHIILQGLVDSYSLFTPGIFPVMEDMSSKATETMNGVFIAAVKISAPHIVIGLILYLGAGILARLVPNIQVFFVMLPAHIFTSFIVLLTGFSTFMMWYLDYFTSVIQSFVISE